MGPRFSMFSRIKILSNKEAQTEKMEKLIGKISRRERKYPVGDLTI